ncbi:MAG: hypothetical protein ACTHPD_05330 [Rhizomicrobium sp.]
MRRLFCFEIVMSHSSLESGCVYAHPPRRRVGARQRMRALLIAEGVTGLIAAVASYLWGYLDGRAEIRNRWKSIVDDLKDN